MALTKVIGDGTGDITKLQILNGSNVRAASSDADDLIVEGPADCGISILSATTGRIYFGDAANDDAGSIRYVHSDDSMRFETNDVEAMRISSIGAVTKPLQPAFLAYASGYQNNIAVGSDVTVVFDTEVFDQNSDFASNTFTAPVTGRYQLQTTVRVQDMTNASVYYYMQLVTSNRAYLSSIIDPRAFDADPSYFTMHITILADMDASDTAFVRIVQHSGTQQTDIQGGSSEHSTHFSGYLVA
tara:strand:- start:18 stop:746 length:729 start_codon:yes stop_codon:yes gene_type:complete